MIEFLTAEYWLNLFEKLVNWIVNVFPGLILLLVVLFISLKLLRFFIKRLSKILIRRAHNDENVDEVEAEKRIRTLMGIVLGIGRVAIWTSAVFIILKEIGIDVKPILAGAGIVGLAVGFGAQELVRDFITGFFILLENQIRTGDVAVINGTGGLVERIELRTIKLRDFSGVVHIFQNGKINSISNMTKEWSAMVFDIGIAYKEDPDKAIITMQEIGDDMQKDPVFGPKILEPIEVVGVDKLGDSAVVIRARIKTKPSEQWNVGREYRKRVKNVFDQKGIEIPFPHQTIYWGEKIGPLNIHVEKETEA
ncbi:MAG: mechanosensitive ion channel family protein [Prolixibacteraceae bacterium]|nr:mechanosensitive ion channel family protein [Prolixibacteraceae bacterium]